MAIFLSDGTFDIWRYVRSKRDAKLSASDWTQMPDSPLTDSKKAQWATYRQTLRDLPSTHSGETDVTKIVFPTKPS